jgi:transposase-like protein
MATVGRPSKYKPEFAEQAAKLYALGATDAQLADFFGVAVSTIGLWKVQHTEFSDAGKVPKAQADERVEQSLYRRAMGYEHDEVDIRVIDGAVVQTPIRKFYPPDSTAMIFWLKNRKPAEWRDKVETEHSGTVQIGRVVREIVRPDPK